MGNNSNTASLDREITDLLLKHQQPDVLLSEIAKKVGKVWGADACWLAIYGAIGNNSRIFGWDRNPKLSLPLPKIEVGTSSAKLDEPLISGNVTAEIDSSLSNFTSLDESIRSLAIAPAKLNDKTVGCLVLVSRQPDKWGLEDTKRLTSLSSPISLAIEKLQIRQKDAIFDCYKTILPELSTALARSLDKDQFFKLALHSIGKALQVDLALVLLLKYDELPPIKSNNTVPQAKVALAEEWSAGDISVLKAKNAASNWNFNLKECSLLTQAYQSSPQACIVSDISFSKSQLSSRYPQFPNWLILPLISFSREANSGGVVLGFIALQNSQSRNWQPEEIALASWISTLTSNAIIQSQTLFQVQNLVEERTAQLQSSLEVQAKLYEKTRQQLEQVSQAKKAREEFIDSISHELRTPLTAMNLAIRMLRQPGLTDERRTNYFNILEQQCNQEIALVNDLLDWGRLESKQFEVQVQALDLCQLLPLLAQSFHDKWTHKGLKLDIEFSSSPVEIQTDKDIFKRILTELLTNAGKYSVEDSTVSIKVDLSTSERQVKLSLTNTGNCIPSDEIAYIFEPLRRPAGTAKNAIRGTGLGLALVKSFVQHLQGTIAVSSNPLDGDAVCQTCFTLTLPQTADNF